MLASDSVNERLERFTRDARLHDGLHQRGLGSEHIDNPSFERVFERYLMALTDGITRWQR